MGKKQLMDQELFNPQSSSVSSSRIIYTPSTFARTSLLHLQEVGSLQAVHPHISQRENLVSFLCFIVLSGEGKLSYEGQTYQLRTGDCVFIDCRKAYSHSTSDNLWSLQWCHFYAPSLPAVYEKYKERGGRPVFHPDDLTPFTSLLTDLYNLASSSDYIRDMRINEDGGFVKGGFFLPNGSQFIEYYHGLEDIPDEHKVFAYPQLSIREQMAAYKEVIDRFPQAAERPRPEQSHTDR